MENTNQVRVSAEHSACIDALRTHVAKSKPVNGESVFIAAKSIDALAIACGELNRLKEENAVLKKANEELSVENKGFEAVLNTVKEDLSNSRILIASLKNHFTENDFLSKETFAALDTTTPDKGTPPIKTIGNA